MGKPLYLMTPLHSGAKRDYIARVLDDKVHCMQEARKYADAYWDGDRRYGYGGYRYIPGRWKPVAEALIERYDLKAGDAVLDLGCGKGYLLYELQQLMPKLELIGMDHSEYALKNRHPMLEARMLHGTMKAPLEFPDKAFALVTSVCCIHNLRIAELAVALPEIQRVGRQGYLQTESFRNESEWFNLVAWCLTAETILRPEDWEFLFKTYGYTGDYEFVYFQ